MSHGFAPDGISHDMLLAALEMQPQSEETGSLYHTQLRHRLLTLARKARLEVAVQQATGLSAAELHDKSTAELLVLLDQHKGNIPPGDVNLFRHFW